MLLSVGRDPHKKRVNEIAKACGLDCIGWAITTLSRDGDQYGGDMLMSGAEIRQAAQFQHEFSDEYGHSKFVTVIIQCEWKYRLERC